MEDAGDHDDIRIDAVLDDIAAVAEVDVEMAQPVQVDPDKGRLRQLPLSLDDGLARAPGGVRVDVL